MFRLLTVLTALLFLTGSVAAQSTYKMPPADVAALVDAPASPSVSISPTGATLLIATQPGVPTIADLAQPELRLAGYRISPTNHNTSRSTYSTDLRLVTIATQQSRPVAGLPPNAKIQNTSWSPDGSMIAFTHDTGTRLDLYTITVSNARASKVGSVVVNNTLPGLPYAWYPDGKALLVRTVRPNKGAAPERSPVPTGPVIQESSGQAAPVRTYQDLLTDTHDEALFEYYATSQLMRVELNGRSRAIGAPAIFSNVSLSPNGAFVLVTRIVKPFSYQLPASLFPSVSEVWNERGEVAYRVAELPMLDNIPIAFNSTYEGRRSIQWRRDADATLFWVEAQDGGNTANKADIRDKAFTLSAPFTGQPREIAQLATRFAGVMWGSGDMALISETWRATRKQKTWRIAPDAPGKPAELIFDLNYEDIYANPGSPMMRAGKLIIGENGTTLYMTGQGASDEGNRPFLDKFNVVTKETVRLWRSEAPWYESVVAFAGDSRTQVVTGRQSVDIPTNYVLRDLTNGTVTELTSFPHPTPQYKDVITEAITYTRNDGIPLSGQLILPAGYTPDKGPLPVVIWAYPREFGSADAAGQRSDSPYQFNAISYWGPQFFVTQGYAVLNNAAMPIVAKGDGSEPNDTFIEQTVANAQAAIDELVRRGVSDGKRLAVGGHSYGAFMTANLLAHSNLFQAGIARSGAYNRSLTPFGFQAEPRDLWEATETYITMSPFFYAQRLKTPILFIHGEADNNSGTFPIQSERMFQAVKGNGGTARLVMLPLESHGYRGRESLMHMLWEQINWLETHVK